MEQDNLTSPKKFYSSWTLMSCIAVVVLILLYMTSLYSYLLFHSLAEMFGVIVAAGIFMITWNSRRFLESSYLMVIGISYLFIGCLDLLHTLSYKGMNVFPGFDVNLPTQLWIAARGMESLSLLAAAFFIRRNISEKIIIAVMSLVFLVLISTIFYWKVFPDCYIEGTGLTLFKKISEYVVTGVLAAALAALIANREAFDRTVVRLLSLSIVCKMIAEMSFTFYISVYGISNLVGHYFKIVSFYFIYRAIIVTGLQTPYDLLFRDTKKSEEELKQALMDIKTLRGLVPVCAWCKKIRDDRGYWDQLEVYLEKHTHASFTHGICPECREKEMKEDQGSQE